MPISFVKEQLRIAKIDSTDTSSVISTFLNEASIQQSFDLVKNAATLPEAILQCPFREVLLAAILPTINISFVTKDWFPLLLDTFEHVDVLALKPEDMQSIERLRYLLRHCFELNIVPVVAHVTFESTMDIWLNIASGGVIYLDEFICAVYKANVKTLHPEKSEFKIAIKLDWGGWSYLPTGKQVPLSSFKKMKQSFLTLKKNPKFRKTRGSITEFHSSSVKKLATILGLYVNGAFVYLNP